jgi:hypothetical protein
VGAFDAALRRCLLQGDPVRLPGIVCKARRAKVRALSVNDASAVTADWPSPEVNAAHGQPDHA